MTFAEMLAEVEEQQKLLFKLAFVSGLTITEVSERTRGSSLPLCEVLAYYLQHGEFPT
jgi:hypothetical protein